MNEDKLWDGFIADDLSDKPPSPKEFLNQGKAAYVGTPMEEAQAALELLQEKVEPILVKLEEGATSHPIMERGISTVRLKSQEARILLEWIVTVLNHSTMLQVQLQGAEQVLGQMDAEIKRLNDGKGLWSPGGDAPGGGPNAD